MVLVRECNGPQNDAGVIRKLSQFLGGVSVMGEEGLFVKKL